MKNFINYKIVFVFILFPLLAVGQKSLFGIKADATISNMRMDKQMLFNPSINEDFGIYFKYYIDKSFILIPEIQYSFQEFYSRRFSAIVSHPNPNSTIFSSYILYENYSLHYLRLPISIGVEPFKDDLSMQAGFYISYLIKAKVATNKDLIYKEYNINSKFEKFDFGISIGVRNEMKSGFNYGVTLFYGLKNTFQNSVSKVVNISTSIGIGYTIGKKKNNASKKIDN